MPDTTQTTTPKPTYEEDMHSLFHSMGANGIIHYLAVAAGVSLDSILTGNPFRGVDRDLCFQVLELAVRSETAS